MKNYNDVIYLTYFRQELHQNTTHKRILVLLVVLACYSSIMSVIYYLAMLPQTYEMAIASLKTYKEKLLPNESYDATKFEHYQTIHVHKFTTKSFLGMNVTNLFGQ